ncbi:protein of unknown function DUF1697 [candidate division TM7 genomosp. GTL1]|nr:protein of unknown function DUF1697 [candidate division TM7 genomosp. GTL1]
MKYAMFLRGINVGGVKVPMADLRECLSELGLASIKTYLQTGNVIFDSSKTAGEIKPLIEKALSDRFGYTAFVLIFPATILKKVINHYPFAPTEHEHRYVIFCVRKSVIDELISYQYKLDHTLEAIAPGDAVVYWKVPKDRSTDTPFSKVLAKPKYKETTTNRNLNTLEKMV